MLSEGWSLTRGIFPSLGHVSALQPESAAGPASKVLEKLFGFVLNVLKHKANEGNGHPGALLKARLGFVCTRLMAP